jgi:hypothetical protein
VIDNSKINYATSKGTVGYLLFIWSDNHRHAYFIYNALTFNQNSSSLVPYKISKIEDIAKNDRTKDYGDVNKFSYTLQTFPPDKSKMWLKIMSNIIKLCLCNDTITEDEYHPLISFLDSKIRVLDSTQSQPGQTKLREYEKDLFIEINNIKDSQKINKCYLARKCNHKLKPASDEEIGPIKEQLPSNQEPLATEATDANQGQAVTDATDANQGQAVTGESNQAQPVVTDATTGGRRRRIKKSTHKRKLSRRPTKKHTRRLRVRRTPAANKYSLHSRK